MFIILVSWSDIFLNICDLASKISFCYFLMVLSSFLKTPLSLSWCGSNECSEIKHVSRVRLAGLNEPVHFPLIWGVQVETVFLEDILACIKMKSGTSRWIYLEIYLKMYVQRYSLVCCLYRRNRKKSKYPSSEYWLKFYKIKS